MKRNSKHFVIYRRFLESDPSSSRIPVLELDVEDAERIIQNERLLSVFQSCVKALSDEELHLTVAGEDNE